MGATSKPLQLLLVEDCQDDAWLLERELKRAGLGVVSRRVWDRQGLRQALLEDTYDLVISDFCLPGFSGLEALHMLSELGLDLPFILVSGAVSEETAASALMDGAGDFLEKGRYSRLIPAIHRELRQAEQRRQARRAPWELAVGERVGGFEVLEAVGEGATSRVYRARDGQGQLVALKLLKSTASPRFQREMEVLRCLSHPQIPRLLGCGELRGLPFLALEWKEGQPLSGLVMPLASAEAVGLVLELWHILRAAHEQGVVHRDVKPGNVLIDSRGSVCLTDFGLSRSQDCLTVTGEGALLGTPAYLAPELLSGQPASAGSDLYALGCLAYELLTGRLPFRGESQLALAVQHLHAQPPSLTQLCPELSPPWAGWLEGLLAKCPQARLASPPAQDLGQSQRQICCSMRTSS